jgi:hypothetical protein
MVRSAMGERSDAVLGRLWRVSNHEARALASSFETRFALLRMRFNA